MIEKKANYKCLGIAIFVFLIIIVNNHNAFTKENYQGDDCKYHRDSILRYFNLLSTEKDDVKKEQINQNILKYFRKMLADEESFYCSFDMLRNRMGVIASDDGKLRILNWNIAYNDGTYKYFGFMQYKKSKRQYHMYELNDMSESIQKPEFAVLNNTNWYGALYYKIITNKYRGNVYYTLLGADLNDLFTKKKIIDILYFNKKEGPVFGAKVFKNNKVSMSRVIFEFNAQANMVLTYDEEREMIVYDHLSPSRPSLEGQYEFYGPDFSYDGLKFERGIWNAYFDIDVRNKNIE